MRILVEIAGWEHGCCGKAFAIGQKATWQLVRAARDDGPLPCFAEEHHGQTAAGVPHLPVTGIVRRIREIRRHRHRRLSLLANELTGFDVSEQDIVTVPERGTGGGAGYRVELEVADDTELPRYVAVAAESERTNRQQREATAIAQAMLDALGTRMRAALHTTAARVTGNEDGSIAAIEPDAAGAATLSWRRNSEAVHLQAGEGRFIAHTAAEFERIVAAVQAGRIREEVDDASLRTVIEVAGAAEIVAEEAINAYNGNGFRALGGRTAARIRRGSFRYEPW
ncbi:hypothetical protein HQQ81_15340 [Microbacteriaceae bacterium VKM Ac-2854]|nr:hypothetical protein [Microbacteriaceae bacterium VKM Ac-2854]